MPAAPITADLIEYGTQGFELGGDDIAVARALAQVGHLGLQAFDMAHVQFATGFNIGLPCIRRGPLYRESNYEGAPFEAGQRRHQDLLPG